MTIGLPLDRLEIRVAPSCRPADEKLTPPPPVCADAPASSPVCCVCKLIAADLDKKLIYRRGTARRAVSVKTVLNVAQMFVEVHLISYITRMTFKVILGHWKWHE